MLSEYDVVVCGGGPAGCAAAIAAARAGLRVLLVEAQGQLGGMGTSGLVAHWLGGRSRDCRHWVVGGLFRELSLEAAERGIALLPTPEPEGRYSPHGWSDGLVHGIPYDPFAMAAFLDERMISAGVEVLFFSLAVDIIRVGDRITHVVLSGKGGLIAAGATAVIDATGDADIAARSGCHVIKGRDEDGLMTPATLIFHVDNVDQNVLSDYIHNRRSPRWREKIKQLRAEGEWPFLYDIFISVQLHEKGVMMINTPRLCGIDGTDPRSVSKGMIRGRAEIRQLLTIMRKHFAGFEQARLKAVAPLLGIRETRRIDGEYRLTVDDVSSGRRFDDTIGYSGYGWDLPDPHRPSHQPMCTPTPPIIPIPYRIMVPKGIDNLICPGRAVSVEHPVLGPLRVMAPCMAMGEAAGSAAAQVVADNCAFRDVNAGALRKRLQSQGVILDAELDA